MKTRGRPRHPDVLTPREWEALTLVREGLTNPQIAERMGITLDAAKYHVSEILSKLQLRSREEAATWQPEPPREAALRPSWANAIARWMPFLAPAAGVSVAVAAVAGLGVLAYGVISSEGEEEPSVGATPSATAAPALGQPSEAEQIVAEGDLAAYAVAESGSALTVWNTCEFQLDCSTAWRLGTSSQTQATVLVGRGDARMGVAAAGDGFMISVCCDDQVPELFLIAEDGTASPLTDCDETTWSTPTEPGRMLLAGDRFVDTVDGTICDVGRLGGRHFSQGVFTADGTLWTLVDDETDPDILTVGRYDGSQWSYHDLASRAEGWTSLLAVAGPSVAVLQVSFAEGDPVSHFVGFAVTTDNGATWSEVVEPEVLDQDFPFATLGPEGTLIGSYTTMAFAGTSTLYVADGRGYLWRSTDFATFNRVLVPFLVSGLRSAGDAVIARIDDGTCTYPVECQLNDLVRISADGTWEPVIAR
jgi:DNA-binding CsgD family transcriptional regulator